MSEAYQAWHDPRHRLFAGLAALALSGVPVRSNAIGRRELALFRRVNALPDGLYPPAWVIMQAGNMAAGPTAAIVARLAGRPRLAARLALSGTCTWALSKVVKRIYRRPRPRSLVASTRSRGPEATGLGYVSGHAGVAVAIAIALLPELRGGGQLTTLIAAPTVALARIYVGAHLPLDVVGGAALGMTIDAFWAGLLDKCR